MNQTNNYQLSQWDPEDRILRTDFNSDNQKIETALLGKLNHGEIIQETTLSSIAYSFNVDLRGINWADWEYLTVTLDCPHDRDSTTGTMYFDLSGIQCYGTSENLLGKRVPGPLSVILPVHHDPDRPIRMLIFPGGELALSSSAFQALTILRLLCSGSNCYMAVGSRIWVEGIR